MPALDTYQASIVKSPATNATDSSFPALITTLTPPVDTTVYNVPENGNRAHIQIIGTDADDETLNFRITGWSKLEGDAGEWIPETLFVGGAVLSSATGAASGTLSTATFFADTITDTYSPDPGIIIASPADNTIASVDLDIRGFDKIQVSFDRVTAASGSALVRIY